MGRGYNLALQVRVLTLRARVAVVDLRSQGAGLRGATLGLLSYERQAG